MARLSIRLLGPFQVTLDGEPAVGFRSDKVRALLAYLCVEMTRRPHPSCTSPGKRSSSTRGAMPGST
jgi:hypothetical protein